MRLAKNLFYLLAVVATVAITSCGDDDICDGKECAAGEILDAVTCNCVSTAVCPGVTCEADEVLNAADCTCVPINTSNIVRLTDNITNEVTWESDKIYVLGGRIVVEAGACLNIPAGTIIKGEAGAEANATALIVARGGKIMAEGTADSPIIFTSVADEIQPGMVQSPNLADDVNGLWGGVIILGRAPISADADAVQIEGIPPSDQNGLYGGTVVDDNSGVLRYVSIRHGGTDIGEGNEINGLTLGGVGNGTVIDHVEVVANVDDGIEFFGGSVNATNCLVWGQGDDAFDCDQAWTGTLDNFAYIAGANSDHALELDGPEGSRSGTFTLKNGSLKGGTGEYCDLRSDVMVNLENIYFFDFSASSDLEFDNNGVAQNYLDGMINITGLQFNTSHLTEGNRTIEEIFQEKVATDDDGNPTETKLDIFNTRAIDASNVITSDPTVGADISEFSNWSLASVRGQLADF